MDTLTYFKLKALASVMRVGLRLSIGVFSGNPDDILQIPSREPTRTIKANVYRPKTTKQPGPVLINFHGSGFIIPLHGSDDEFCRYIAENTNYTVLDVSYRMAPESPFPAALNDVEDSINYVKNRPDEFDISHISLSGFSAGANLAMAASSSAFAKETFYSLIAFYPVINLSIEPSLKIAPDTSGKSIPPFVARVFNQCYIPPNVDVKDPRVSPSFAAPEMFPSRILMITCARDNLAIEAEELAERLESVPGNHVIRRRMEECDHGFNLSAKKGTLEEEAKNESYALVVDMLQFQ